jgi:hypothetical protein
MGGMAEPTWVGGARSMTSLGALKHIARLEEPGIGGGPLLSRQQATARHCSAVTPITEVNGIDAFSRFAHRWMGANSSFEPSLFGERRKNGPAFASEIRTRRAWIDS